MNYQFCGKGAKQSKYNFLINKDGGYIRNNFQFLKGTVYKGENQGTVFG